MSATKPAVCETCNNTKQVCECHLMKGATGYDKLHPPHGEPFYEWNGPCPKCRHGVGGSHTFVPKPDTYPPMGHCLCGAMKDDPDRGASWNNGVRL